MKAELIGEALRHLVSEVVLVHNEAGEIIYVTPSVEQVLGYPEVEFLSLPTSELFHPEDIADATATAAEVRKEAGASHRTRLRMRHRAGHYVWCEIVGTNLLHTPLGGVCSTIRDISEQRALEERLKQMTIRDDLTGLLNRRGFMQMLETTLDDAKTHHAGLLMIDLDGFKPINDTLGRAAGDEALRRCARLIRDALRPGDVAARIGGDEFAVICHRVIDRKVLKMIADRIRKSAGGGYELEAGSAWLGVSVGAVLTQADDNAPSVMELADRAMYAAKQAGRDRVAIAKR